MPFFGIEDVLFLLASTSPLLWIKRHEVIEMSVYGAVKAFTQNSSYAAQCAKRVVERYRRTPILLLREIDINSIRSISTSSSTSSSSETSRMCESNRLCNEGDNINNDNNLITKSETLIRTGLAGSFRETPARMPNVPHRFFNSKSRTPHVSYLAYCNELEISKRIQQYTRVEVQTLFNTMESEGLWESVVRVSRGIEMAHCTMTYLSQLNIESALRTLFAYGPSVELALAYYFAYGEDILPSDDILVALFDACRSNTRAGMDLYISLRPFRVWWSEVTYACCLTTLARCNYAETIALYQEYLASNLCEPYSEKNMMNNDTMSYMYCSNGNMHLDSNNDDSSTTTMISADEKKTVSMRRRMYMEELRQGHHTIWERLNRLRRHYRFLTSNSYTWEQPSRKLNYLYHIIIPLVAEHAPSELSTYVADMLRNDKDAAPDVFLKCLRCEEGRKLANNYLQQCKVNSDQASSINFSNNDVENEYHVNCESKDYTNNKYVMPEHKATTESFSSPYLHHIYECRQYTEHNVVHIAFALYMLKPCAMNMNSLLEVILWHYAICQTNQNSNAPTHPTLEITTTTSATAFSSLSSLSTILTKTDPTSAKTAINDKVVSSKHNRLTTNNVCLWSEHWEQEEEEEEHISKTLCRLLQRVPLREGVDAAILARTLTTFSRSWASAQSSEEQQEGEQNNLVPPWHILEAFTSAMLMRQELNVIPLLAQIAMRINKFAFAARVMSIYLSNQRGALTSSEVNLCIEASVRARQWDSALFWLERASSQKLSLTTTSRELVREAVQHSASWQGALRLAQYCSCCGSSSSNYLSLSSQSTVTILEAASPCSLASPTLTSQTERNA